MAIALPDLIALSLLIVVYGLITAGQGLINLLNWFIQATFGKVPYLGSIIAAPLDAGLQAVSSFLGSIANDVENYMGWCFHNLATEVEWIGRERAGIALLDAAIAEHLADVAGRAVIHEVTTVVHEAAAGVVDHTNTVEHTVTKVADLALAASVGALEGRLGSLEHEISDVLDPTVEGLRERARELEDSVGRVWGRIKAHEEALAIGAVTAAVAVAVDELGASWIRCEGSRAVGKALCGLGPELLEELLAATLLGMAVGDVCELLDAMLAGVQDAGPVFELLTTGIDDLLACQHADRPPDLPYTVPALPPLQKPAALILAA